MHPGSQPRWPAMYGRWSGCSPFGGGSLLEEGVVGLMAFFELLSLEMLSCSPVWPDADRKANWYRERSIQTESFIDSLTEEDATQFQTPTICWRRSRPRWMCKAPAVVFRVTAGLSFASGYTDLQVSCPPSARLCCYSDSVSLDVHHSVLCKHAHH